MQGPPPQEFRASHHTTTDEQTKMLALHPLFLFCKLPIYIMQAAIPFAETGILAKSKCQKEMQLTWQTEISLEPSTEANHTERRRPHMDPGGIKPLVSHISQAHHHVFSALCSCSISISVAKSHLQQSKDKFSAESYEERWKSGYLQRRPTGLTR